MGCLGNLLFIKVSPSLRSLPPLLSPAALLWDRFDRETSPLPVHQCYLQLICSCVLPSWSHLHLISSVVFLFTTNSSDYLADTLPYSISLRSSTIRLLASSTNTSSSTVLNFILRLRSLLFTQSASTRFAPVVINTRILSWLPATRLPTKCAICFCEHAIERYFRRDLSKLAC